jgi:hypothetical protein
LIEDSSIAFHSRSFPARSIPFRSDLIDAFRSLKGEVNPPFAKRVVWESQISTFFVARKSPKNAKNLFDATPYAATTSDPIRAKNKNITGFGPRDLIDLDS